MNGRIKQRTELAPTFGALPMIGKIKVGMKVWNAKANREIPTSLDYFRATGPYAPQFHEKYGEKPTKIEIVFPSNDIMQVCREEIEGRGEKDGKRYGYSYDGETYFLWDEKEGDYLPYQAEDSQILLFSKQHKVLWKKILYLNFVLLKIRGVIGQWQFSTKGEVSSMPQITHAFDTMREAIGTIMNVPFDLQVEKVTSQKPPTKNPKTGKLENKVFPVVKLIPNISAENMEVLRGYLQTNGDFKRFGVVMSDEKIEALAGGQHALSSGEDEDVIDLMDPEERRALIQEGDALAKQIAPEHPKVYDTWEERKAQNSPGNNIQKAIDYMKELLSVPEPKGDTPDSPEPPADAEEPAEKSHDEKLQDIAEVGSEEDRMVAETALTDQDYITFNKTYERVMGEAHAV